MTFDQRVQLFMAGFLGGAALPGVPPDDQWLTGCLDDLAVQRLVTSGDDRSAVAITVDPDVDLLAMAGYVRGLHQCFPDSGVWLTAPASDLLAKAELVVGELSEIAQVDSPAIDEAAVTDYWLGRWAAVGLAQGMLGLSGEWIWPLDSLQEIIRRAKHRDGSTAAIVASSDAVALLTAVAAHPLVAPVYRSLGFDPERVQYGNFPRLSPLGSPEVTLLEGPASTSTLGESGEPGQTSASLEAASADLVSAELTRGPGDPDGSPEVVLEVGPLVSPDFDLGQVRVSKVPVSLSITAAGALSIGLGMAIRSLLIPAEGYRWLDHTNDPLSGSLLLVEDPELARGLPLMDQELQPGGPWLHGEVRQAGVQDEGTGQYTCRIYTRVGRDFAEFGSDLLDIHEAKFRLASRVRAQLGG